MGKRDKIDEELFYDAELKMRLLKERLELIDTKLQEIQIFFVLINKISKRKQAKILDSLEEIIGPGIKHIASINRIEKLLKLRQETVEGIEKVYKELRRLDIDYSYFVTTLTEAEKDKFLKFNDESKKEYATAKTNQYLQMISQQATMDDLINVKSRQKNKFAWHKN